MMRRSCSGSCCSPRLVDAITSQKRTVTVFRAATGADARGVPHAWQARVPSGFSSEHWGQATTSGRYAISSAFQQPRTGVDYAESRRGTQKGGGNMKAIQGALTRLAPMLVLAAAVIGAHAGRWGG